MSHFVEETDNDFVYNMTLFKTLESEQTYSVGIVGVFGSAGVEDFTAPGVVFLFPPGSETLTVYVNISGDTRIELTEQFMLRIVPFGGPPFPTEDATVMATVNIVDNDGGKFFLKGCCLVILERLPFLVVLRGRVFTTGHPHIIFCVAALGFDLCIFA